MKGLAALLLAVLATSACAFTTNLPIPTTTEKPEVTARPNTVVQEKSTESPKKLADFKLVDFKPLVNPKDALLEELQYLDDENTNSKIQEEVAKALKAQAQKPETTTGTPSPSSTTTTVKTKNPVVTSTAKPSAKPVNNHLLDTDNTEMKKLYEAEDIAYEDAFDEDEDSEEEDDDEYDEDDEEDELDDEEDIMTDCPDYCTCTGTYATTTTATCTKLVEDLSFGPGIAHLKVENAGEIRLGPHALRNYGLLQLESVTIVDTKIVDLDRTAFDGITYLFSVNLTRNGLQEIHPQTFQNNSQLSLLTISGNPLRHAQLPKTSKHYLLDAPSVTELVYSNNGLSRLPKTAFAKMQSLAYINLSNNRLRDVEKIHFSSLENLVELDLSNNMLSDIPDDLLDGRGIQTLRISGNNLTTLAPIRALKLTKLDASNNRIKVIAKDDLLDLPMLDELNVRSNGLKKIHQHAFSTLDQLAHLDISDNKLTTLTDHHLRNNPRLQTLVMNDNPDLGTLPIFKTDGLEYDTFSVYRFECANCGLYNLQEGTFDEMPAITRLNLAKNHISSLPKGLLAPLSSLRQLDLSDNNIETLEHNMFKGAVTLSKLSLAGNPLVTLQVTPFLNTPGLSRLDVSRCTLERVWSEARVPLKSLRFLSVRDNLLARITLEELKAMPQLTGLDLSHNPLVCDQDFQLAIQWLTDHSVRPTETLRSIGNYGTADDYAESDGISQWVDLAKVVCDNIDDGPPPRPVPHKPKDFLPTFDVSKDSDVLLRSELDGDEFDNRLQPNDEVESAWANPDQVYEIYRDPEESSVYRAWYGGALWPILTVIVVTMALLFVAAHLAICLAKRRGRGPVIRPPMILRQGLVDNKNCGLVYKPLQEEIATPHMPKRGSFYSSSTFHYDKIVPESV